MKNDNLSPEARAWARKTLKEARKDARRENVINGCLGCLFIILGGIGIAFGFLYLLSRL